MRGDYFMGTCAHAARVQALARMREGKIKDLYISYKEDPHMHIPPHPTCVCVFVCARECMRVCRSCAILVYVSFCVCVCVCGGGGEREQGCVCARACVHA